MLNIKIFLIFSFLEESQPDELLEESLENQGKRLRQVLFINKSLTVEQEISGKPCTLDINIFPAETMPCKFDTTGSTYLLLSSLAPHCQYSKKTTCAPNVCENWLFSIKDGRTNTGENSFAYSKNVKTFGHKVIQHPTIQTLPQAFEYNESRKDKYHIKS